MISSFVDTSANIVLNNDEREKGGKQLLSLGGINNEFVEYIVQCCIKSYFCNRFIFAPFANNSRLKNQVNYKWQIEFLFIHYFLKT